MTREQAYTTLAKYLKNPNLIKHCLACEAVMKALARKFRVQKSELRIDEDNWGIVGLLHDADYELSKGHPEKHGLLL